MTDIERLRELLAHCDGKDCICMAYGQSECGCGCDWTPAEVYELRAEVESLKRLVGELENLLSQSRYSVEYMRDVIKEGCDNWHACNSLLAVIDAAIEARDGRS
jgi:hypothetical protein